jgi:hypothetical protein
MMQLKEAGGFEAVVEHVAASEAAAVVSTAVPVSSYGLGPASAFGPLSGAPPLSAPAQTGSAEMFAAQLMSKHVAPFLVSAMSDSAAAVVIGAVRQHLGSKKRPVIEAYVEAHVIAELLKLLSSPQPTVREDSLGCLVIVAASSSSNRDAVIALGALASLAELIAACSADANERGVLRTSVTLLKSMISMKPVVDAAVLVPVYPEMSRLVCHEDVEVQLQVCEALAAVTDGTDATHAPTIFQHFDLSGIASLLTCADSRVCSTGARIVRNLVRSSEAEIVEQLVSRHDCIARVTELLKTRSTSASQYPNEASRTPLPLRRLKSYCASWSVCRRRRTTGIEERR